jgi:hypothetical protein
MKKLRMIVTSVVVLAIVGGAFAFKTKAGAFCIVDAAALDNNCTTYVADVKITTGSGTSYRYYPAWDGTKTACTPNGGGLCTASFKLTAD